ncbi:hypothetical protein M1D88_12615 [Arthrobacter sp. R1-13]
MNTNGTGSETEAILTEAASRALDELLAERRKEIVSDAVRTSSGEVITAADVVRAYYSAGGRRPLLELAGSFDRGRRRRQQITAAASIGILALIITAFIQVVRINGQGQSFGAPDIIGVIGVVVGMATAFAAIILQTRSIAGARRYRERLMLTVENEFAGARFNDTAPSERRANDAERRGMFLSEWGKVEESLRKLARMLPQETGQQSFAYQPIGVLMANLARTGIIDRALSSDIRKVITVRNMVAHQESVPRGQMEEGMVLLNSVEERLSNLQRRMPPSLLR